MALDRIDLKILDILQTDNQISNAILADRVGLSAPACSRRISRLRNDGIITKNVAILDAEKVGKSFSAVVTVTLEVRRKYKIDEFATTMQKCQEVSQCMLVSGSVDYVIIVNVDDIDSYKMFAAEFFAGDENVRSYESLFVLNKTKFDTKIFL